MLTEDLNAVAATPSKLEKEALLVKAFESEQTKRLVRLALDPFSMFHIVLDEDEVLAARGSGYQTPGWIIADPAYWEAVEQLLEQLTTRKVTGNAAKAAVTKVLAGALSDDHVRWTCRIINKDLRAGFSVSTANKASPGLLEPFQVALASPYEPKKHKITGSWSAEKKLDGLRLVLVDGVAYTRNGKPQSSVDHILEQLASKIDLSAYVVDGEVMSGAEFNVGSGNIRRSENDPTAVYHVFDIVDREEWRLKKTAPFGSRRDDLYRLLGQADLPNVKVVENIKLPSVVTPESLEAMRDRFIELGFEGVMLKDNNAPYTFKRSKNLLKIKLFETVDVPVVGFEEGKNKNKGTLGSVLVDLNGVVSEVGSGWSDEDRAEIWNNQDKYMGKILEVQFQNLSPTGCMRFPTVVRWRPDKDMD